MENKNIESFKDVLNNFSNKCFGILWNTKEYTEINNLIFSSLELQLLRYMEKRGWFKN